MSKWVDGCGVLDGYADAWMEEWMDVCVDISVWVDDLICGYYVGWIDIVFEWTNSSVGIH